MEEEGEGDQQPQKHWVRATCSFPLFQEGTVNCETVNPIVAFAIAITVIAIAKQIVVVFAAMYAQQLGSPSIYPSFPSSSQ
ncbi:hypothetical protein X798_01312 [Onchocerca flexuosa]|uniref:GDT1 family protein n=2 Tax=Onchocerca flexuosa TaxID=387005 RepID=A0A183HIQ5_9BILA|nr:hypothetical protein X798_01312 [Onchocerca flexuosa]VDO50670.1 unnamed protein product [Onchocerca flexuosa]